MAERPEERGQKSDDVWLENQSDKKNGICDYFCSST